MHTKLTIPERLKDLRVSEKRMSLQELSDATDIPSSTLGNYEKDENIDMSLGNLITLANFYNVSTDYLLCRTELRCREKKKSAKQLSGQPGLFLWNWNHRWYCTGYLRQTVPGSFYQ